MRIVVEQRARRIQISLTVIFIAAILLLTVPTLFVIFYEISETWFKVLNTIGLLLATFRVVTSLALGVTVTAVKGESTEFKKRIDRETKWLFIMTIVIQFFNFTFVHFS